MAEISASDLNQLIKISSDTLSIPQDYLFIGITDHEHSAIYKIRINNDKIESIQIIYRSKSKIVSSVVFNDYLYFCWQDNRDLMSKIDLRTKEYKIEEVFGYFGTLYSTDNNLIITSNEDITIIDKNDKKIASYQFPGSYLRKTLSEDFNGKYLAFAIDKSKIEVYQIAPIKLVYQKDLNISPHMKISNLSFKDQDTLIIANNNDSYTWNFKSDIITKIPDQYLDAKIFYKGFAVSKSIHKIRFWDSDWHITDITIEESGIKFIFQIDNYFLVANSNNLYYFNFKDDVKQIVLRKIGNIRIDQVVNIVPLSTNKNILKLFSIYLRYHLKTYLNRSLADVIAKFL